MHNNSLINLLDVKSMYKNELNSYNGLDSVFLNEITIYNSINIPKSEQDIFLRKWKSLMGGH